MQNSTAKDAKAAKESRAVSCSFAFFAVFAHRQECLCHRFHVAVQQGLGTPGLGYPQNVILYLDLASRKLGFDALRELWNRGRAVLAVEAASVVHKDDVRVAGIAQDGLKFAGKALLIALEASPAVIAGVEPEERGLTQRLQQIRYHLLAIALVDMHVRRTGKLFCGALRQR